MKNSLKIIFVLLLSSISFTCRSVGDASYQSPTSSGSSPGSTRQKTNDSNAGLTNAKVETAVNSLVGEFRLGGRISVKGVQELPQQNAAVADLQFDNFEYGVTNEGALVKAKDFNPKSMPKDQSRYPTMEEMFPQRKISYSQDGKATLSHYTDGRWVLKDVRWGLDTGINGNVEVR